MIVGTYASPGVGELGFSAKPPEWLRNLVANAAQSVKANVSIPTPAGNVVLDLRDPATRARIAALADAAKRAKLSVSVGTQPAPASPLQTFSDGVRSLPGGWLTVGGGIALLALAFAKARS